MSLLLPRVPACKFDPQKNLHVKKGDVPGEPGPSFQAAGAMEMKPITKSWFSSAALATACVYSPAHNPTLYQPNSHRFHHGFGGDTNDCDCMTW